VNLVLGQILEQISHSKVCLC